MKMNPLILSVWLLTFLIGGLAVGQEPDEQEAHLKPFPATERGATNIFTLAPQQTGIYNVRIDEQDNDGTYELDGDPNVTYNPGEDGAELWIWEKTGGGDNTFEFTVVNTIWEERSVTVTVTCTWVPVPAGGGGGGGEGEAPGPIDGRAEGIARHKWGALVPTSDIAVDGAPDYLCINETISLSSWLVRDEFEYEDYALIESNWRVEGLAPSYGGGTIEPNPDHTVVFTPTNTGLVRVTATESLYSTNSGSVEFTIVQVEITTEDEPGNLICVGGTKNYNAVVTPTNVQGTFAWSVSDTNKLDIVGADNQQTVTVTGKVASAAMNDEELTVEFRINDELICEPSTNLTVFELVFIDDEESEYNFSPSLGEEAKLKVRIEPSLDLDFPAYYFGIQIVRFTKTGTEQSIGWVPLDNQTSMVPVDFGVETFTWNGKAGESVPAVEGLDEFTGANDNRFHRHLPAVTENQNLPPPVYTALAKITTLAGETICEAQQNIFVPQIVKLAYDADAVTLIRQSLSYIDEYENEHELFAEMTVDQWDAVRAHIRSKAEAYYSDANVNLRIVDESDSPGSPYSTITFSKGTDEQNYTGEAPQDFPNKNVNDEGWHFAHGYRRNIRDFAPTVEFNPDTYGALDDFFPVTREELAKYAALTVTHEIGHMLGLVDQNFLGGENGNHNPYIPPGNSSDIMDESPRGLWRAIGREVQGIVVEWTWKQLNEDYLRFVLPKGE